MTWIGVGRAFVAIGLIVAAMAKLLDREASNNTATMLGFLPTEAAAFVARLLVPTEIILGIAVLAEVAGAWSVVLATTLLLGFAGALVGAWLRGVRGSCHCYGLLSATVIGPWSAIRPLVLAIVGGWTATSMLVRSQDVDRALLPLRAPALDASDLVVATLALLVMLLSIETVSIWPRGDFPPSKSQQ